MKPIYISSEDHHRLNKIVNSLMTGNGKVPDSVQRLREELDRATVMDATALPPEVITLNSRVRFRDMETKEVEEWTLVLPERADTDQQRISILAPIGTGLLGFAEGDEIEWETPGGVRRLRVEKVEHAPPDKAQGPYSALFG